jgi:hypothetical protein
VAKAESDDYGNIYLGGLIAIAAFLFMGSAASVGVMFWIFGGPHCQDNLALLSLTIVLCIMVTLFQLFLNSEYSLVTSAVMTAYCTYICYSALTLNPDSQCNPTVICTLCKFTSLKLFTISYFVFYHSRSTIFATITTLLFLQYTTSHLIVNCFC